jgi:hypothetical protein
MSDDDDNDDRFERWCDVNGIVAMRYRRLDDGREIACYFRADGSEVIPSESFGYDAKLTPYTKTSGRG